MSKIDSLIESIILPYFNTFKNTEINSALFALDGTVIGVTVKAAQFINLDVEDALGLSYKSLSREFLIENGIVVYENNDALNQIIEGFRQLAILHEAVITEKRLINYIDFMPYKKSSVVELVSHFPIFNPAGEVIATQTLSAPNYVFGYNEYVHALEGEVDLNQLNSFKPKLDISEREHEVIFLLQCRSSQAEVADILGISNKTVHTIISRLCAKFKIFHDITGLLHAVAERGLNKYIPQRFSLRQIIVLDPEIRAKYFSKNK